MDHNKGGLNLIFLCSGLEPGRDGVGDYTRRLAANLLENGAAATIIALNDRFADASITTHQFADGVNVPVMRLPSTLNDKERYALARDLITALNPQWISLQFVPFGFHEKGLKAGLSKWLLSLSNTARWHVMIHELWVGMDAQSTAKHKTWGWVQRQLIASLLKKIKPTVITTQAKLYQQYLQQMGYKAHYMPLYSNISVANNKKPVGNDRSINFVLFGNIHHGGPAKEFIREVADYGKVNDISLNLTLLGHCGPEQETWVKEWTIAGLQANIIGKQSSERISDELHSASIGITTTPLALTDKSGSFAAMRAHGLPVISVSRDWHPQGVKNVVNPNGVFHYQKGNFKEFYDNLNKTSEPAIGVDAIAQQLESLLSAFNGKF
ncbi:hypothetical protein [Mucilaginibacter sp.]|uniref:hypothetical protein n=1 Tax=Mucilaginibacter sp. TaxID=1882438 RepID=UPI0035BC659D